MGNYFVKTIETGNVSEWHVCQRPKWEKEPVVVATKALVSDAESLAWELTGLNGGYFTHQPHEKAWAVGCVPITHYSGWVPIWTALSQKEAETLVIGLNNSEVFNYFSCDKKDLGELARRAENLKSRIKVFPTHAVASPLPCANGNIDLEAGTIVPFTKCCTCSKDEPENRTLTVPTPEEDIPPQFRCESANDLPLARCHCGGFGVIFPAPPRSKQVRCVSCGCAGASEFTEEEAIIQWNILAKASTSREKSVADLIHEYEEKERAKRDAA